MIKNIHTDITRRFFLYMLILPVVFVGLGGCKSSQNSQNSDQRYRVTFNYTWASSTHPTNFPSGPHFSGLIGATHNNTIVVWATGRTVGNDAYSGIESMAETGGPAALRTNFTTAGDAIGEVISGSVISSPGSTSATFTAKRTHALLSVVSMLAPSPDWFVGVHDVNLLDGDNWIDDVTMDMVVYDAGTDSGPIYNSENSDTSPKTPISRLNSDPNDTSFLNGLPRAGTITIEQVN